MALVGVDGEWRGSEVRVLPYENSVIEAESGLLVLWMLPRMNPSLLTHITVVNNFLYLFVY